MNRRAPTRSKSNTKSTICPLKSWSVKSCGTRASITRPRLRPRHTIRSRTIRRKRTCSRISMRHFHANVRRPQQQQQANQWNERTAETTARTTSVFPLPRLTHTVRKRGVRTLIHPSSRLPHTITTVIIIIRNHQQQQTIASSKKYHPLRTTLQAAVVASSAAIPKCLFRPSMMPWTIAKFSSTSRSAILASAHENTTVMTSPRTPPSNQVSWRLLLVMPTRRRIFPACRLSLIWLNQVFPPMKRKIATIMIVITAVVIIINRLARLLF